MAAKPIRVDFSVEEAQALLQLIDAAVRANGLGVAQPALVLSRKIEAAIADANAPKPPKPPKADPGKATA
jgi:hypothetical protein